MATSSKSQQRAVLYGRVSAVMGRGDDLTSPELQEHVARDYCARRGYEPVQWLCDVDETGRSWSRRQVEQAVQMIERHEVDVIVVPRWSRFTRNLGDYVMQTSRVEAAGGRLESALEETDPQRLPAYYSETCSPSSRSGSHEKSASNGRRLISAGYVKVCRIT